MKQLFIMLFAVSIAVGCSKERDELEARLKTKFANDQDIADYKIDPDEMADCVSSKISGDAPGFPGSPSYEKIIGAYAKLVRVDPTEDFRPALEATKKAFGSAKEAHKAAFNITNHTMACIGIIMQVER